MYHKVIQITIVASSVLTGCTYDYPGPCLESCIDVHISGDTDAVNMARANAIFGPAGIRLGDNPEAAVHIYVEIGGKRGRGYAQASSATCDGYVHVAQDRGPLLFAHELGHALTLPHTDRRDSLMRHTYIWDAHVTSDEYDAIAAYVSWCASNPQ